MSLILAKTYHVAGGIYDLMLSCLGNSRAAYEPIASNTASSSVIGAVRIVVQAANLDNIMGSKSSVIMRVQGRPETSTTVGQSKVPEQTLHSSYFLVYSLKEQIEFQVLKRYGFLNAGTAGKMMVSLTHLETEPTRMGREEGIFKSTNKGSKRKGSLLLDMFYYPILQVPTCSNTGIVTLRIGQAKGLLAEGTDIHSEKKHSKLMVVTRMDWTSQPIHKSHEAYDVDEPSWNCSFDFLCFDKSSTTIVMKIVSKRWNGTHVEYGHVSLALNELVQADRDELGWWPLSGFPNGRLQVTADWKPIELHQDNIYKE